MRHPIFSTPDSGELRQLAGAVNAFGIRLLHAVTRDGGTGNTFLSPFSVFSALAMLYDGAGGSTREALAEVLQLPSPDAEALNRAYAGLLNQLSPNREKESISSYQLDIANSLWLNRELPLNPAFARVVQTHFKAEAATLDMRSGGAASQVNRWVAEKTSGKITSIIDRVDPATLLLLLNAVYFKGLWRYPFSPSQTAPGDFTLANGSKKTLPMMRLPKAVTLPYLQTREFEAAGLPYGDSRLSCYLFLPARGRSLDSFTAMLSAETWQQWMPRFHPMEGKVILPRFRVDYSVTLNRPLKKMGLAPAFSPTEADFRQISTGPQMVFLGDARHKSFLEVNEVGTEAAAVTSFEVLMASFSQPRPFLLEVDRPFFCAIVDNDSGVLLFTGLVTDPESL